MSLRISRPALCLLVPLLLCAQKKPVTMDAAFASRPPQMGARIHWAPDGKTFLYQQARKLFLYDVAGKSGSELLDLSDLEKSARKPAPAVAMNWENRRVSEEPVQWAQSGSELLLSVGGDLFLFHLDAKKADQLTATEVEEADPKLSPDGTKVSFRRAHDLYVMDLQSKDAKQLTEDGSATVWNAELDWVYPEELALGTAHWWSPDSKSIAYLQFDIGREHIYPHSDVLKMQAVYEPQRYPKAGTPNADVRLGVVSVTGPGTRWIDAGETRDALMARVQWAPDSKEVFLQKLNRAQSELQLLGGDPATGQSRLVAKEVDETWVNVKDDPLFLKNGDFLWTSERSGFRHIYLFSRQGEMKRRITRGEWEVTGIEGVDQEAGLIYFVAGEVSPLERHLYSIKLDGKGMKRLTQAKGSHTISMSPKAGHYLDTHSSLTSATRRVLYKADGSEWTVFKEADHTAETEYEILPTEVVQVKAEDGALMYGRVIRPANFQAGKKYPAIVMVYGGPGAQSIRDSWPGLSWEQALAHKGFVIWQVDNRGSAGRGHKWESKLYRRFGRQELEDQLAGVKHLLSLGYVDAARIGMYGWSYGGFMTLYSLTNAPDTFKAGVAGAPVTDWRNYDTIYTERYLGLPRENGEGYRESSPVTHAAKLKARLMIVHNIEDDNVLFGNSMQMMDALQKAGKQFELQLYPQKAHGVTGPVRKQMYETITAFFEKNLM